MPINNRVMPDCIVITARNTHELYGCAEGLKRCARQPEEDGAVDRSVSGSAYTPAICRCISVGTGI